MLTGGGFAPGAEVTISFHSAVVVVGSVRADSKGHFAATVTVPAGAIAGAHHFEASGMGQSGQVVTSATAVEVTTFEVPVHHGSHTVETLIMVTLAVLIPLITWLVLSLVSRRNRLST